MGVLVNELSWSVSRQNLFDECRRAYYFNYYGAWGGWDSAAAERTRQLYILKNLKTLDMWAGAIVHEVIAEALRRYQMKTTPIRAAELQAHARQKLRAGWVEAVNREWESSPKKTNLRELYYGNGKSLPPAQTERIKGKINDALLAFAESAILKELLAASYLTWKPIDKLDSFLLDGIKVWCAIDFAYTDPVGQLRIMDWKTGAEDEDALKLQLACYAFFASEKWRVRPEQVRLFGVFLREGARCSECAVDPGVLIDAKDRILSGAAAMRALLADAGKNEAHEDNFPFCEGERSCSRCNFRQLCPRWSAGAPATASPGNGSAH